MNEIVWPCNQIEPATQVVVGRTANDELPPFLKYGCSVRKVEEIEVTGKRVRNERGQFAPA